MSDSDEKSVIHRKAMGARSDFDARVMSPAKALRLALAKASDKLFDLALTVTMVEQQVCAHAKLQKDAGDDGLLVLLDGAGGKRGALKVDIQVLAALIEVQTMGMVRRGAADPRPVTPTDAAIVAPLVDGMLNGFDEQLKAAVPEYDIQAFRFGDMIEDARTMALALEAPDYDVYRLTLDMGEGAKIGVLTLMLPQRAQPRAEDRRAGPAEADHFNLEKSALEAPVALDTVLARIKMPLKKVCELAPGMRLPIDGESLIRVELVASGGQVVSKGCIGQIKGWRAVRLSQTGAAFSGAKGREGSDMRAPRDRSNGPDDMPDGGAEPVPDTAEPSEAVGGLRDVEADAGGDSLGSPEKDIATQALDPANMMLAASQVEDPEKANQPEDA